jgi:hypothetical protein
MPQYLVAIQHPDGYDGAREGEAMQRDISELNKERRPPAPGFSPAASLRPATRNLCGRSKTVR